MPGAVRKRWLILFVAPVLSIFLVAAPLQARLFSDTEEAIVLMLLLVSPTAATVGFNVEAVYPSHPATLQYLEEFGAGTVGGTGLAAVTFVLLFTLLNGPSSQVSSYCVFRPWCIRALDAGVIAAHVAGTAGGVLLAGALNGARGNALLTVAGAATSDLASLAVLYAISYLIQVIQPSRAPATSH